MLIVLFCLLVVDKRGASEDLELSTSASNVNLSGNICMHETVNIQDPFFIYVINVEKPHT